MNLTEGTKLDQAKVRYDLFPPEALHEIARVFTFGAGKYEDRNWEKGISFGRVFSAAMRHLWSWWRGETFDPETGINHLAHAAVNCIFLLTYELRRMHSFDSRPVKNKRRKNVSGRQ